MVGLTNTSFGLLIAYLLPGLAGLVALSYWSRYLRELLKTFSEVESSVGLFLLVVLLSLIVGLQVTIVRSVIFEVLVPRLSRQERPPRVGYQALKDADTFAAFSGAIDAYYRYHQFWGGMTVIIPGFIIGWLHNPLCETLGQNLVLGCLMIILVIGLETVTAWAALEAYSRYRQGVQEILQARDEPLDLNNVGNL